MRSAILTFTVALTANLAWAQTAAPGRTAYDQFCARCHGADGRGGQMGPGIVARLSSRSDVELASLVRDGLPARGMPALAIAGPELRQLIAFLRTLRAPDAEALPRVRVETVDGATLDGVALNQSPADLQLRTDDGRLHLLRPAGTRYRRVTSDVDWPGYHGAPTGNRFSRLDRINRGNVARLAPAWMFALPGAERLQVTPVVVEGVMYVTNVNECYALDAGSGRRIWHYRRARTKGLAGDAAAGINRGVAVGGDRVFLVTDNARLLALNRFTGALLWDAEMADWRQNYGATSAPLVVGSLVVSGISGGDEGVRGFLAAFDQATGKEVWRFWTVPRPGEPGADTWRGRDIEHGCASTWLTGTYDADLDTLYWPTGNPCPDYDGRQRQGDNLYSDSILALDPATGRLKWHFQYTPHDVWDWDAQQPPVLVDAPWRGQTRRLLLHANRNGFFYVLDRTSGDLLQATPFVKKLTWATGIGARWPAGADARPGAHLRGRHGVPGGGRRDQLVLDGVQSRHRALLRAGAREVHGVHAVALHVAGRQLVLQRVHPQRGGRGGAEGPARAGHRDRRGAMGGAADRPGTSWGGALATAGGLIVLRRRQRRVGRGGCRVRRPALALPDQHACGKPRR